MKGRLVSSGFAFILCLGVAVVMGQGGSQAILGKWLAKADTPNGPMEIEFEFRQEGTQLAGTALIMGSSVPLSNLQFDGSRLTGILLVFGESYQIAGGLRGGKLSGNWEQAGGDMKGTWSADRAGGLSAAGSGAVGSWDSVAVTPGGDLRAVLDVKQEGEGLTGTLSSDMGSIPVSAVTFKDGKFHFEVEVGGTVYAVDAELQEGALKGKWAPLGGETGGEWSATRRVAEPSPAAAPAAASLAGNWDAIAESPDGQLSFEMQLQQAGESISGQLVDPDGSIALQKATFSGDMFSFEVEYMGGIYRIDLTLHGTKLAGKWTAVSGTETGKFSAQKKTP